MSATDKVRQQLEQKKIELLERLKRAGDSLRHTDKPPEKDFAELATERENEEVLEVLQRSSHDELLKINKAIDRIDQGHYFECSSCSGEIASKRLEAIPYTTLCINCAEQQD